ncbi:MAG: pyridoxamine 5'-phosphate oxidase family protein [Anaerohalosphaera sp.]|nr:pyridoxamine 5'-phosphate oxidase family protein [Anaerohalosphaera sp.]
MNRTEVMEFVEKNMVFALATSADGIPKVRNMVTSKVEDRGIIFCTGKEKDVYRELSANANVELCYYSAEEEKQVRIAGQVQELDELDLKKEIVEKFPFLKPWIDAAGYEAMAVYLVINAKACMWSMETNNEPKTFIDI